MMACSTAAGHCALGLPTAPTVWRVLGCAVRTGSVVVLFTAVQPLPKARQKPPKRIRHVTGHALRGVQWHLLRRNTERLPCPQSAILLSGDPTSRHHPPTTLHNLAVRYQRT